MAYEHDFCVLVLNVQVLHVQVLNVLLLLWMPS